MSTENLNLPETTNTPASEKEERRRRGLLLLLLVLLLLFCCVGFFFLRYLLKPQPLPELVPVINQAVNYPPTYAYSIYEVDQPVGVAVSPDGARIYVTESGGERLVKVFDRDGNQLGTFAPPGTTPAQRAPVYIAVAPDGRVFVSDRLQHSIFIYDADGNYIDSILNPALTLSKYLDEHMAGLMPAGTTFYYNIMNGLVNLTQPGQPEQALPAPSLAEWSPMGVRFDNQGNLLVTDASDHKVHIFLAETLTEDMLTSFPGESLAFGGYGSEDGQMMYPNCAVADSQGRIYAVDGNNGRVTMWDPAGNFLRSFGRGTGDEGLNLPRGAWMDNNDRLHVVDAVGQTVRVYDVSGDEPAFLYLFGDLGESDGLFYYPNDIYVDASGHLFVVDRENNRVQVWSY